MESTKETVKLNVVEKDLIEAEIEADDIDQPETVQKKRTSFWMWATILLGVGLFLLVTFMIVYFALNPAQECPICDPCDDCEECPEPCDGKCVKIAPWTSIDYTFYLKLQGAGQNDSGWLSNVISQFTPMDKAARFRFERQNEDYGQIVKVDTGDTMRILFPSCNLKDGFIPQYFRREGTIMERFYTDGKAFYVPSCQQISNDNTFIPMLTATGIVDSTGYNNFTLGVVYVPMTTVGNLGLYNMLEIVPA